MAYSSSRGYKKHYKHWAIKALNKLKYKEKKSKSRRAKTAYRNRVRTNPEARAKYIAAQTRKIAKYLGEGTTGGAVKVEPGVVYSATT